MIKTVITDLGGVYFTDGTRIAINKFCSQYELNRHFVKEVLEGDLGLDYRAGSITVQEFWTKAKMLWNINNSPKELNNIWVGSYETNQECVALFNKIRKSGYKLLYLSNNVQERVNFLQKKYSFLNDFDDGIFSHDAKIIKPNSEIYSMALQIAKDSPEECVYIDNKDEMIPPANILGMKTIKFENVKQLESELRKIGLRF